VWGMDFIKISHNMLLICIGYAMLSLLIQKKLCSFGSPYIFLFLLEWISLVFQTSLFCCKYASEYYSDMIIESKHTCIEFCCIHGLTLAWKYSNFVGNVRRSFIETNQSLRYSSNNFTHLCLNLVENLK